MKYKKINQKEYCCVPACLQMVLHRNNLKCKSQEDIGYELGLIVPSDDRKLFKKVRVGDKPHSGYGTQVNNEKYSINNFFIRNNFPLIEEYHYIIDYKRVERFLKENVRADILVCFHCGTLYGNEYEDWGHVCVIDSLCNDEIILVDPDLREGYKVIKLNKLIEAIKKHGENNRAGFWLIKNNLL